MFIYFHILCHIAVWLPWVRKVSLQCPSPALFRHTTAVEGQNTALNWRQMPAMGIAKSFQALQEALGSSGRCFQWHFFLFQSWQIMLPSEEGGPKTGFCFFCLGSRKAKEMKLQLTLKDYRETLFTIFQVIISASGIISLAEIIPDKSKINRFIWKSRDTPYFSFFKSDHLKFHSVSAECMRTVPIKLQMIICKNQFL